MVLRDMVYCYLLWCTMQYKLGVFTMEYYAILRWNMFCVKLQYVCYHNLY